MINIDNFDSTSTEDLDNLYFKPKERFDLLKKNGVNITAEYEDLIWSIYNEEIFERTNIRFRLSEKIIKNKLSNKLVKSLKSWCLLQIEDQFSYSYIGSKVHCVLEAIEKSNCFNPLFLDFFKKEYFKEEYKNNSKYAKAAALYEFINYSEIYIEEEYIKVILLTYESHQPSKDIIRNIPPSHDILKFSLLIEDFFNENMNYQDYLLYYPIYLWWNLTNLIPLRIREFCLIKYECLVLTDEGYLIELPRTKGKKERKIRYDRILISDTLAHSILEYKKRTCNLGKTKTLLHYMATRYHVESQQYRTVTNIENQNIFSHYNFTQLLEKFYRNIVNKKYRFRILEDDEVPLKIENEKYMTRRIRPNDTRHFAFLNLMLQGYHPSEIARLGGHKYVTSQFSYHNHLEYWVDSDLVNLLMSQQSFINDASNYFFQNLIFKQKIVNPLLEETINMLPLRIGYCTDLSQNCMVEEHYLCEHWRITLNDYQKHSEEIHKIIGNQKSFLQNLVGKLVDLHRTGIFYEGNVLYSEENPKFNYLLLEQSKKLKQALYNLYQLKEKVSMYEKQR